MSPVYGTRETRKQTRLPPPTDTNLRPPSSSTYSCVRACPRCLRRRCGCTRCFRAPHCVRPARDGSVCRCNRHLLGLGQHVKRSLVEEGIIGYQFGTVGVSDGISMGTRGMSYSLQSRDLIADQVETAAGGHWLDGMVVIPGCDKNMPGVLMARTSVLSRVYGPQIMTLCSRQAQSSGFNGVRRHHSSW